MMAYEPGESALPAPQPQGGLLGGRGHRVVIIDTDPGVRWSLEKGLARSGYEVRSAGTVVEALRIAQEEHVAGMIMELLPEAGLTLETLSSLVQAPNAPRVVCVSVDSDPQTVIECMRRGAADFLPKPFSLAEVRSAMQRALERGHRAGADGSTQNASARNPQSSSIVGVSPAIQELRTIVQQVAQTNLNCLLRGESGVGKDIVAREIHRFSQRKDKPFIKVNCSALPEQLLESELFGYEKGAFTGAVTSKPGRFNLAHRGIIFLDEIADMHPNLQAKILQVIEHKEFTKLGGSGHTNVDVQIIAATNADLEQKTSVGDFRSDLYFRLNEVCIEVPPLRDRKEDIPLLMHHFIQKHGHVGGLKDGEISREELASLLEYDWPGNVRELESTVKRWLALGRKALGPAQHRTEMPSSRTAAAVHQPAPPPSRAEGHQDEPSIEEIRDALEQNTWNRRKAAQTLGMSYQVLRRRIEKYGLDKQP